jgi:preprotein translocase subunit YajC
MPDLFLYVLLAAMLVMMFLSSRKRKAAAAQLQEQVVAGAKVVLLSGIVGEIVSIDEDKVVIISAGSKLEILKGAIRTAVAPEPVSLAKASAAKPATKVAAKPVTMTTTSSTEKPAAKKQSASTKK